MISNVRNGIENTAENLKLDTDVTNAPPTENQSGEPVPPTPAN